MSNIDTELKALTDEIKELEAKRRELLRTKGHQMFELLFNSFPDLEAVVWTQYTPGWNDGEPCYFGVYDFYTAMKGDYDNDENYDDWRQALDDNGHPDGALDWPDANKHPDLAKAIRQIMRLPEDFYEFTFGNGKMVIATKEGFETRDYDCGY